ncbi:hypothetical protein ATSB10_14230 [Dyella thiooxydans]|uniref:N-acetyltransferase domain-containing protein n=1 Tax=Dyella thiooxydans TaxID=445710 RepID=A0A160N0L2_9GAMM|nr:GNAT family N-acetyltransferase [Dyella thiooxydans]AND68877.1 hypothetical protein ATSB10_14230 [Dyella thiooxydans]
MLQLTPIAEAHLPDVQRYASDPAIGASSYVPSPYPDHGAIAWYATVARRIDEGHATVFAITEDDAFRGVLSLNDIDATVGRAHLDYWVATPYQHRGVATAATALAVQFASAHLRLKALLSTCLASNLASLRVLERNGFVAYQQSPAPAGKFEGQTLLRLHRRL